MTIDLMPIVMQKLQARKSLGRRGIYVYKNKLHLAQPGAIKQFVNEDDRSARFIISTKDKDRVGDTVEPLGIELDDFALNPTWSYNHETEGAQPVGTAEKDGELHVKAYDDHVEATCFFHDITELARNTYDLVAAGVLRMTSIGFLAKELDQDYEGPGIHILKWGLLEIAIVFTPCNAKCSVIAKDFLRRHKNIDPIIRKSLEEAAAGRVATFLPWMTKADESITTEADRRRKSVNKVGQEIAKVTLDKEKFPVKKQAVEWAFNEGFKTDDVEETYQSWIFTQRIKDDFVRGSLHNVESEDGVTLTLGDLLGPGEVSQPAEEPMIPKKLHSVILKKTKFKHRILAKKKAKDLGYKTEDYEELEDGHAFKQEGGDGELDVQEIEEGVLLVCELEGPVCCVQLEKDTFPTSEEATKWIEDNDFSADDMEEQESAWVFHQGEREDMINVDLVEDAERKGVKIGRRRKVAMSNPGEDPDWEDRAGVIKKPTKEELITSRTAGYEAHKRGDHRNPHPKGSEHADWWDAGHEMAKDEGRRKRKSDGPSEAADAWEEGGEAYYEGKKLSDNPYKGKNASSECYDAWKSGYKEARAEDKEPSLDEMHERWNREGKRYKALPSTMTEGCKMLHGTLQHLKHHAPMHDHPEVKAFYEKAIKDGERVMRKIYKSHADRLGYGNGEGLEVEQAHKKFSKKEREVVDEAVNFMTELAEEDNLTSQQRAGCRYHGTTLRQYVKEPEIEIKEEDMGALQQALTSAQGDAKSLSELFFSLTGRRA